MRRLIGVGLVLRTQILSTIIPRASVLGANIFRTDAFGIRVVPRVSAGRHHIVGWVEVHASADRPLRL
jgi:hypothetical protein